MTVSTSIRYLLISTAFLAVSADVSAAKPRKQDNIEARLQLEALGFPGFSARLLGEGASVLTVNFADDAHLLVTFGTRGLVARHAGEQHNDQDRMVAAELVEISSGQVVARTEWLLHDHGRYLWPLGHGRFLVRIENSLSTFAPAANLKEGHAFDRVVFAVVPGTIDAVSVATDNQLVLVNSSIPRPKHPVVALQSTAQASRPQFTTNAHQLPPRITSNDAPAAADAVEHSAEILSFFRIAGAGTPKDPLEATPAGTVFTTSIMALPVYSDGYLQPMGQDHIQWHVDFHPFSGKNIPLAPIETSCAPNMTRVGPAQFVAMTCRGISANTMLVAYDLEQHEIWDEPLPQSDVPPSFVVAASAGRFAISRFLTTTVTTDSGPSASLIGANNAQVDTTISTNQDLRIYQTQTGDLLLKMAPSPAFKTGENFDLSADGLRAAVVHDKTIDIYRLPEPTKVDKEDLAELAKIAPPPSTVKISFNGLPGAMIIDAPTEASSPANPPNVVVMGDTNRPTQPPSLLTDGEKAQFPDKSTKKPE